MKYYILNIIVALIVTWFVVIPMLKFMDNVETFLEKDIIINFREIK